MSVTQCPHTDRNDNFEFWLFQMSDVKEMKLADLVLHNIVSKVGRIPLEEVFLRSIRYWVD